MEQLEKYIEELENTCADYAMTSWALAMIKKKIREIENK